MPGRPESAAWEGKTLFAGKMGDDMMGLGLFLPMEAKLEKSILEGSHVGSLFLCCGVRRGNERVLRSGTRGRRIAEVLSVSLSAESGTCLLPHPHGAESVPDLPMAP